MHAPSDSDEFPAAAEPATDGEGGDEGGGEGGADNDNDSGALDSKRTPAQGESNGDDISTEDGDDLGLGEFEVDYDFEDSFALENQRVMAKVLGEPMPVPRISEHLWCLERLGDGGMGTVYAAYDGKLQQRVAIKFLRLRGQSDVEAARLRLVREARAMARVRDRGNVVHVYDIGVANGRSFLVMEFIGGERGATTLREWQSEPERGVGDILDAYLQAARGLAAIHRAGLVHRDVKPANVFVTADERERLRVVVGDLGLAFAEVEDAARPAGVPAAATAARGRLTGDGALLGTVPYMAPEQLRREDASARSDQFSFCVALFEALCGARPFPAPDGAPSAQLEAIAAGVQMPTMPPGRKLPKRVMRALLRGLSPDPEQRFADMEELAAALTPPERRYGPWLLAACVVLVVCVWGLARSTAEDPCVAEVERKQQRVWNTEIASLLEERIASADDSSLRALAQSVLDSLEAGRENWRAIQIHMCQDGVEDERPGEYQSELTRHTLACLSDQEAVLAAAWRHLEEVLAPGLPSGEVLGELVLVLEQGRRNCVSAEVVRRFPIPLDYDPEADERVAGLKQRLVDLELATRFFEDLEALEQRARAALEEAEGIEIRGKHYYPPIVAAAKFRLADILTFRGAYAEAEDLLTQATATATARRDEYLTQALWLYRSKYELVEHGRRQRVASWLPVLSSALLRAGSLSRAELGADGVAELQASGLRVFARAEYWEIRGLLAAAEHAPEKAQEFQQRARNAYDALLGAYEEASLLDLQRSKVLNNLANVEYRQGQYEQASAHYTEVLRIRRELFEEHNPLVTRTLLHLALAKFEHAQRQTALAVRKETYEEARVYVREVIDQPERLNSETEDFIRRALVASIAHRGERFYALDDKDKREGLTAQEKQEKQEILAEVKDDAARLDTLRKQDRASDSINQVRATERFSEYTALASAAEMAGELDASLAHLERAFKLFEARRAENLHCPLADDYRLALYSAATLLCGDEHFDKARERMREALQPVAGCDETPGIAAEIRGYAQWDNLAAACIPD